MILYSTNCPKCNMLEKRLYQICEFDVITDIDEVINAAKKYGMKSAPILVIDDKAYNFEQAMKMINELVNKKD